ncbi:MAG: hypothetical protein Kow0037_14630 [Calditrichia bacterium]
MNVFVEECTQYNQEQIDWILKKWQLMFYEIIKPGQKIVLKPNWLAHAHKYDENEWLSVITHPMVITGVLKIVLKYLNGRGQVTITDGPQTDSNWQKIMQRMTPELWIDMGKKAGIPVKIMDLREDEWINENDVTVERRKLPGDPLGSTEVNLGEFSEFANHIPSPKGYYGADYDKEETNRAHSDGHHRYRVSRTAMEADVFINLPKMKTHKKAGITCSLKNLVGINTYKNFLPHHNEGTPDIGGDQFPEPSVKNKAESVVIEKFKQILKEHSELGRLFIPVKKMGKMIFGDTRETIRSGNWWGNDTLWRMVLDLNKILLYANPDGSLKEDRIENQKKYISIVDGIIAGEGNGPEAPDRFPAGVLIAGTNPLAVDAVCAKLMGFDWQKIPSIKNGFNIQKYPIADFAYEDIRIHSQDNRFNKKLVLIDNKDVYRFKAHFGWAGQIELD